MARLRREPGASPATRRAPASSSAPAPERPRPPTRVDRRGARRAAVGDPRARARRRLARRARSSSIPSRAARSSADRVDRRLPRRARPRATARCARCSSGSPSRNRVAYDEPETVRARICGEHRRVRPRNGRWRRCYALDDERATSAEGAARRARARARDGRLGSRPGARDAVGTLGRRRSTRDSPSETDTVSNADASMTALPASQVARSRRADRRHRRARRARASERGFVTTGEIFAALPDLEPETAELAAIYAGIDAQRRPGRRRDRRGAPARGRAARRPRRASRRRATHRPRRDLRGGAAEPRAASGGAVADDARRAPRTRGHRGPSGSRAAASIPVRMYLKEIGKVPLLTGPQEVSLAQAHRGRRSTRPSGSRPHLELSDEAAGQPRAVATRRRAGQAAAHRGEPAARRVDRQALRRPRHGAARPHPGGQPRAHPRGREVRLHEGLQVLDVRDVVDPPGDHPRDRRPGAHHPHPGAHGRDDEQGDARAAPDAAGARARADGRGDRGEGRAHARPRARDPAPRPGAGVARDAGGRGGRLARSATSSRTRTRPRPRPPPRARCSPRRSRRRSRS